MKANEIMQWHEKHGKRQRPEHFESEAAKSPNNRHKHKGKMQTHPYVTWILRYHRIKIFIVNAHPSTLLVQNHPTTHGATTSHAPSQVCSNTWIRLTYDIAAEKFCI